MKPKVLRVGSAFLFIFFLLLISDSLCADEAKQIVKSNISDTNPSGQMIWTADSLSELRHLREELLLTEFSLRHENLQDQENMFIIMRILLMVIIIGLSMMFYVNAKNKQIEISRMVIIGLLIIIFAAYWYDQFLLDQHFRVIDRVGTILYVLNDVPTMTGDQLRSLPTFEVLTWPIGAAAKIGLFFKLPNFPQLISYGPMLVIIILLSFRSRSLKKSKQA